MNYKLTLLVVLALGACRPKPQAPTTPTGKDTVNTHKVTDTVKSHIDKLGAGLYDRAAYIDLRDNQVACLKDIPEATRRDLRTLLDRAYEHAIVRDISQTQAHCTGNSHARLTIMFKELDSLIAAVKPDPYDSLDVVRHRAEAHAQALAVARRLRGKQRVRSYADPYDQTFETARRAEMKTYKGVTCAYVQGEFSRAPQYFKQRRQKYDQDRQRLWKAEQRRRTR